MHIFITGISKGIGKELAIRLVKDGNSVWGIARDSRRLRTLAGEVKGKYFLYSTCDVSKSGDIKRTLHTLRNHAFIPDVVILNAAICIEDTKSVYNHEAVRRTFASNFFGALEWVNAFLPEFLTRKKGHFIAISSTSAYRPDPVSVSLPASKAALSMAFRSLRLRYTTEKIIFSTIHFGPVATSISPKYASHTGRPKYPFVLTASQAAEFIQKVVRERKPKDYFFPFFITSVFRASLFLPDSLFIMVSNFLKQR